MLYHSTRGPAGVSASGAITRGIAADGGLFVPESFPRLTAADWRKFADLSYPELAAEVLKRFLTDFSDAELAHCVKGAYCGTFENDVPAPLVEAAPDTWMLELWHGPTCAFKDMALQLLPYLLTAASHRAAPGKTLVILVATSGDTGKAALAGFADVPGTKIMVFFPERGVSPMQKFQMVTQPGNNVTVCGIEGNFDDAQNGVKAIFTNETVAKRLAANDLLFSSANSINFGRLVPQVVYYVASACELMKRGRLKPGETFHVAVPTGNFGDILAAFYAKQMGTPIGKLICASNRNRVLTDFLATGVYDRNREFFQTSSPSMDILISSNLERLLYHQSGNDSALVKDLMEQLKRTGRYAVPAALLQKLQSEFYGGFCDEAGTVRAIRTLFAERHYLCDPHTAVAVEVLREYREKTGDRTPTVIASTASPYKFAQSVLPALTADALPEEGFARMEKLSALTGTPIPQPLAALKGCAVRHRDCIAKAEMESYVLAHLA